MSRDIRFGVFVVLFVAIPLGTVAASPRDTIGFTFEGDDAIAGERHFDGFSQAAAEAGRARIFAGIHFEFSNQAGQEAGRGVAGEILDTRLLRTSGPTHIFGCPR